MEGLDGIEKRKRVMSSLRTNVPLSFGGVAVVEARDYLEGIIRYTATGKTESTGFEPSDVLYYVLANGDKIVVRPSGTEPKIKIYVLAHGDDKTELDKKIEAYCTDANAVAEV